MQGVSAINGMSDRMLSCYTMSVGLFMQLTSPASGDSRQGWVSQLMLVEMYCYGNVLSWKVLYFTFES
jgi:hypothetical protein